MAAPMERLKAPAKAMRWAMPRVLLKAVALAFQRGQAMAPEWVLEKEGVLELQREWTWAPT